MAQSHWTTPLHLGSHDAESESNLLVTQGGPAASYIMFPWERRTDFAQTHTLTQGGGKQGWMEPTVASTFKTSKEGVKKKTF